MGLKASYINYFILTGLGVIVLGLVLSMIVPTVLALFLTAGLLVVTFAIILFYSKTYGQNGFIKKIADKKKPDVVTRSNKIESLLICKKE
jgi:hypothetical protein